MIEDFIAYLKSHVGRAIYVWGAQGQTDITEAWIRKRENNEESNIARALALWNRLKEDGVSPITAFDCSGLVMYYLQNLRGIYQTDLTAAGLYRECLILARNELREGDLIFRHNGNKIHHVGIYVGKGRVIECKGRDEGVVENDIDGGGRGYWNRYGRLGALQDAEKCGATPVNNEGGATTASCEEDATLANSEGKAMFAVCTGGSVNLRAGQTAQHAILTVVHRGDPLLALSGEDGWCAVSTYTKGKFYQGYMSEKYIRKVEKQ